MIVLSRVTSIMISTKSGNHTVSPSSWICKSMIINVYHESGANVQRIRHWNTMQTSSSFQRNMLTLRCNSWHQLFDFRQVVWGEEIEKFPLFWDSWNPSFSRQLRLEIHLRQLAQQTLRVSRWVVASSLFTKPQANRGSGPESTSRKPQGASDKVPRGK